MGRYAKYSRWSGCAERGEIEMHRKREIEIHRNSRDRDAQELEERRSRCAERAEIGGSVCQAGRALASKSVFSMRQAHLTGRQHPMRVRAALLPG